MTGTSEILVPVPWHTCQFTGASWLAPATGTRKLVSVYDPVSSAAIVSIPCRPVLTNGYSEAR